VRPHGSVSHSACAYVGPTAYAPGEAPPSTWRPARRRPPRRDLRGGPDDPCALPACL